MLFDRENYADVIVNKVRMDDVQMIVRGETDEKGTNYCT